MIRPSAVALVFLASSFLSSPTAASSTWDLIYTDSLEVKLCDWACSVVPSGWDFALLANTGSADIAASEYYAGNFSVTSSRPELYLILRMAGLLPPVPPVAPGEVVGGVDVDRNSMLRDEVLPGETYRNTAPGIAFAFQIGRVDRNTYEGPVDFDVVMTLGGRAASFTIHADVSLVPAGTGGNSRVAFQSAARVSSVPEATPAVRQTWTTLKRRYR